MRIAVFCSGNGSNFQAIADASRKGVFKAKVALMVSDNPNAYAIERAKKEGVKAFVIERANFSSKREFEDKIADRLKEEDIGLICLAGYMRILSGEFIKGFKDRILNIHPALLPSFKGAHGIKDALEYGTKVTGVTVHFVTEDMDAGPIILQEALNIDEGATEASLAEKIHLIEHRLYPEAIRLYTEGRLSIAKARVRILMGVVIFFLICGIGPKSMFGKALIPAVITRAGIYDIGSTYESGEGFFEDKIPRMDTHCYKKLGLAEPEFYDINASAYTGHADGELINAGGEYEKGLTEEDLDDLKIEGSIKIASYISEAMDSFNMPAAQSGIDRLIDTTKDAIDFRDEIGKRYNLYFKFDKDEALLRYKRRF